MDQQYRPTRFQMQFLGILHRILKSAAFNIFMLILGFGIGFGYVALTIHYYAVANSNYEFVAKIEQKIKEMAEMDVKYTDKEKEVAELLKQFKLKISHDSYNIDGVLRLNTDNS